MKYIYNPNSCFPIIAFLFLFLSSIANSQKRSVLAETKTIDRLYDQLRESTHRIETLQKLLQNRPKMHLYDRAVPIDKSTEPLEKSGLLRDLSQQIYKNLPQFHLRNLKQSLDQTIHVQQLCKITTPLGSESLSYNYVSSNGQFFIFISNRQSFSLQIYSLSCQLLTRIQNLTLKFVFEEEKSTYKSGFNSNKQAVQYPSVYAVSDKNQLIVIDLSDLKQRGKQSVKNAQNSNISSDQKSDKLKLYRVLNSKLISPNQNTSIIGVLIKTLTPQQARSKQGRSSSSGSNPHMQKSLFVAYDTSQIKVFDEMGTQKIIVKENSVIDDLYQEVTQNSQQLHSISDKSLQLLSHHPFPILLETNWIYFIDTKKYSRQLWGCPHIPKVKKLFVQNTHSSEVFILTDNMIYKVNLKGKDPKDGSRKGLCEIEKSIPYFDPFIHSKKTQEINFSVHKNLIFLDKLVYNMTSNSYLAVSSPESLLGKKNGQHRCQTFSLQFVPYSPLSAKKSPTQKHSSVILRCRTNSHHALHVFSVMQVKSESSILIYIIFAFIFVVLIAVKFFKSSSASYEKEMFYPANYSAEEKQLRTKQFEQLNKYLDQAKNLENVDQRKKGQKNVEKKHLNNQKYLKSKKQ